MKPIIGITPCSRIDDYVESVEARRRRAAACSNPQRRPGARARSRSTALLLTGGLDVDPALYGEAPHPTTETSIRRATASRSRSRARAVARDMPLFAICRGVQVLNVAAGGTLVQDIPQRGDHGALRTRSTVPKNHIAHAVRVDARQPARRRRSAPPRRSTPARSTAGTTSRSAGSRRGSWCRRCRRTAWSKRSSGRRRRSASACSGTRRTSGGPANSRGLFGDFVDGGEGPHAAPGYGRLAEPPSSDQTTAPLNVGV